MGWQQVSVGKNYSGSACDVLVTDKLLGPGGLVYYRCMARTNIDIDDGACTIVMRRYGLNTKRDAVNFALRELAAEITADEARGLKGSGWEGDLEEMRGTRAVGA